MKPKTPMTSRDMDEKDALIQSHLDSDSIGKAMRKGKDVFYAFFGGSYFEGKTKFIVAQKMYKHSIK